MYRQKLEFLRQVGRGVYNLFVCFSYLLCLGLMI